MKLASSLRRARDKDIEYAMQYMQRKKNRTQQCKTAQTLDTDIIEDEPCHTPFWNRIRVQQYVQSRQEKCFLVLDDFLVDATAYMKEHVSFLSTLLYMYSAEVGLAWRSRSSSHLFSTCKQRNRLAGCHLCFPKP